MFPVQCNLARPVPSTVPSHQLVVEVEGSTVELGLQVVHIRSKSYKAQSEEGDESTSNLVGVGASTDDKSVTSGDLDSFNVCTGVGVA
mmetsp:Transcript_3189/g.3704  ORF Transcript_3189/g.3704 Transcript_3189/m.3704 type:complete len:88 (-) Transcript_3189:251-514(-)